MSFIIVGKIALLIVAVGVNGLLLSFLRDPFEALLEDIRIKDYFYALTDLGLILVIIGGMILAANLMAYIIFG